MSYIIIQFMMMKRIRFLVRLKKVHMYGLEMSLGVLLMVTVTLAMITGRTIYGMYTRYYYYVHLYVYLVCLLM